MIHFGADFGVSARDIVWPLVALVLGLLATVAALAIFLPASRNVMEVVTPLIGLVSTIALTIGGWVSLRRIDSKVDQVVEVAHNTASDTAQIKENTNGKLHAAVKAIAYDSTIRALNDHRHQGQKGKIVRDRRAPGVPE